MAQLNAAIYLIDCGYLYNKEETILEDNDATLRDCAKEKY